MTIGSTNIPKHMQIKATTSFAGNLPLFHQQQEFGKIRLADNTFNTHKSNSEIIHEAAQYIYSVKPYPDDVENASNQSGTTYKRHQNSHQNVRIAHAVPSQINIGTISSKRSTCSDFQVHVTCATVAKSRPIDHIYEEIGLNTDSLNVSKYDITDYYEKYSPTTAKMLIDTLFLPGHKICKICASMQRSVIYSDRLIRFNEPLHAKEVTLLQIENCLYFKHIFNACQSNFGRFCHDNDSANFIPIYNTIKPNTSGILYSTNSAIDVFDLKSTLEPSIRLIDSTFHGLANTELYHRNANYFLSRISANGFTPMVFNRDPNNFLKSIKSIGYETDLNNWINYRKDVVKLRSSKPNELPLSVIEPHPDRSSLLLLEPLLFMPELSNPRRKKAKNRITHSEHLKIVRMMIAYTLAFFLLAIVTFYIIYFS